jgi:spermidine synthase
VTNPSRTIHVTERTLRTVLLTTVAVTGVNGIVAQVILLRELLVSFLGNELSIGIILANWLILEAAGAIVVGRIIENAKKQLEIYIFLGLLSSLSLLPMIYFARIIRGMPGFGASWGVGFGHMVLFSLLILLPVSFTHGGLFSAGCRLYSNSGAENAKVIGTVYIFETIGTALGGAAVTFFLIPHLHSFNTGFVIFGINCAVLFLLSFFVGGRINRFFPIVAAALFVSIPFFILTGFPASLHRSSVQKQYEGQKVLLSANSRFGNIAVTRLMDQYTFYADGVPVIIAPHPDTETIESFVHFPMLFCEHPENVLVISGGAGGVIYEILKHAPNRVDYAELDPLLLEAVIRFHTPLTMEELKSQNVHVSTKDGRLFLKRTERTYDIILVGLDNPSDLQTNRLYTREFFSLAEERLDERGIIALRTPGSLSYLNREMVKLNLCVLNAMHAVYSSVYTIPGEQNIFLASPSLDLQTITPEELVRRLEEREIDVKLIIPGYIRYRLAARWQRWFRDSLLSEDAKTNRDFTPIGVYYSLGLWHAVYAPAVGRVFNLFESLSLKGVGTAIGGIFTALLLILMVRKRSSTNACVSLAIATTGFAGMMFNLLIIFSFQVLYGYVYSIIGMLIASFMAGTGSGGAFTTLIQKRVRRDMHLFFLFETLIILFAASLPLLSTDLVSGLDRTPSGVVEVLFFFLCFAGGFSVGAQFPLAGRLIQKSANRTAESAGTLYASDLSGGFIGGVMGGAVLLPVLGLTRVCAVVVFFKLVSLFLLLLFVKRLRA